MDAYHDGLNYVPLLAQSTPPPSNRTRSSSLTRNTISVQKGTFICYNGNYEGDMSMFNHAVKNKEQENQLHLVETDSDTEYKKELEAYQVPESESNNQVLRVWKHYKDVVLTPERLVQIVEFTEQVNSNYFYQKLCEFMRFGSALLVWLIRLALTALGCAGSWSQGFWKCRTALRSTTRRLLWWMTLTKGSDLTLFTMILLGTPLLFAVATLGFILSGYCLLKEWLSCTKIFIRIRVN